MGLISQTGLFESISLTCAYHKKKHVSQVIR